MIPEVGAALRSMLAPLLPDGATVRLGAPRAAPDGGDAGDVLNLFLAEVREDTSALAADWDDVRDEQGTLIGRQPPTRRFDLLYLVTAEAGDPEREGALLDATLTGVAPDRRLQPGLLSGSLARSAAPVLIRFDDRGPDVYRAYGLPPRTVLAITVNAPLVRPMDTTLAPPADHITIGVDRGAGNAGRPASPRPGGAGRPAGGGRPAGWRGARISEDEPVNGGAPAVRGEAD